MHFFSSIFFCNLKGSAAKADYLIARSSLTRQEWEEYGNDPAYEETMAEDAAPIHADFILPADVSKLCIGTKKDHIVVCEEGMELRAATDQQIERYENGIR